MNMVLVVDDNQDLCQLLSEILEEAGYNVGIACDGRAALDKIKKERHDVMILDYKLSGISGLTVLKKTRQIRPSLRTIMISAYGNESVRKRAQKLEAYAFLDKPFNIDRLKKTVKKALTRQRRRCVNETNLHKLHSRCSPNGHLSSSGFCSGTDSGSLKDRHPVHIGAG